MVVLFSLNLMLQILCIATVHIYNISTIRIYNCCATYEKRTSEIHNSANNLYFERSFNGILSEYYNEWNLANFNSLMYNRTYKIADK